jgi:hypothetical protein|tara:strand:+ start:2429 stop:3013 length:585 start_codon:yes stop_codon:yes gene_type:complete
MTEKTVKSIGIDYQTWAVLSRWAEDECRTVGGQIRWLVNKYGPDAEILAYKDISPVPTVTLEDETVIYATGGFEESTTEFKENEWLWKAPGQKRFRQVSNFRQELLKIMMEYASPITNSELYILAKGHESEALKSTSLKRVISETSSCYSKGLVKRRRLVPKREGDNYEFMILEHAVKLFRDQKKALAQNSLKG